MTWNLICPDERISEHEVVYLKPLKLPEDNIYKTMDGVVTQEQIVKASDIDIEKLDKEEK